MGQSTSSKTSIHTGTVSDPERTTLAIVTLVAEAKGCEPTDLEPLSNAVNPEALADLVRQTPNVEFDIDFDYEGGRVSLSSDGAVEFAVRR